MTIAKKVEEFRKEFGLTDSVLYQNAEPEEKVEWADLVEHYEASLREVEEEAKKEMMEWHNKERNALIEHRNAVQSYDNSL